MRVASIRQVELFSLLSGALLLALGCSGTAPPNKKDGGRDSGKNSPDAKTDSLVIDGIAKDMFADVPSKVEVSLPKDGPQGGSIAGDAQIEIDGAVATGGVPATGGQTATGGSPVSGGDTTVTGGSSGTGGVVATGGSIPDDAGIDQDTLPDDGATSDVPDCTDKINGAACGDGQQFCYEGQCKSGCLIGETYYALAATNPSDDCQLCNPILSMTRFSLSTVATCRPTMVSAGGNHTCAIANSAAWCWGENAHGQLGNGTVENSYQPVQVTGLSVGVSALSAGLRHTCAIVNGEGWCWGDNTKGQLGTGLSAVGNHPTPLQVPGLSAGIQLIAAGDTHTCASLAKGVICWGYNGRLPTPVDKTATIAIGSLAVAADFSLAMGPDTPNRNSERAIYQWENQELVADDVPLVQWLTGSAIFAAGNRGCAIYEDTLRLRCWSYDTWTHSEVFSSGVAEVALGPAHSCAVVSGSVQCWGANAHGQLGNDRTLNSRTPVAALGLTQNVTAIAAGVDHSCAIVLGEVRCWGANGSGQLGIGTVTETHVPASPIRFLF